jgi:hypothetical protein
MKGVRVDKVLRFCIVNKKMDMATLLNHFDSVTKYLGKVKIVGKLSDWPDEDVSFWVYQNKKYRKFPRYGGMQIEVILEED